ncbi:ATPase AAA [Kitasatospora herbaricolor]|uniref:AAA family ATPase n=1 Tax=Kitasatospora herbaricolor TaxID=68217 RepID=UPI00174A63B2|nr:MoxR family ATPase [Kitasatospora herbaricolor]MDQ0305514.1 MoxR-like ATPase [Kitasatospora herbaricolor]GGV47668.1 ATPase AAA [Kitasatospora herbaricolor]
MPNTGPEPFGTPDRRDGLVYVPSPEIELAVEVALATGRPLLLRGEPGSGKSSLAPWVARKRNWRYYEHVVTSHTRAKDLLWTFDSVRRLADAQALRTGRGRRTPAVDTSAYVVPGPLWWAFAPYSAADATSRSHAALASVPPLNEGRLKHGAVVLIDEIDKADPDVPNGLLVPLASNEFFVTDTGTHVSVESIADITDAGGHLIVITTNDERMLPQAFLRRCVIAELKHPETVDDLVAVAECHLNARLQTAEQADLDLAAAVAKELQDLRARLKNQGIRLPSTAEYLDALWACRALAITPGDPRWETLKGLTLIKRQQLQD